MGWFSKLFVIGIVGFAGYTAYDLDRGGYFSLPDIPDGAYPISFGSGMRAIVYDLDVTDNRYASFPKIFRRLSLASPDRKFFSLISDVPKWSEKAWATCHPGSEEERAFVLESMTDDVRHEVVGARLDAICYVDTEDNQRLVRGLIYSVPS